MKWYNEDNTKMIDLEAVKGFVYIKASSFINENPTAEEVNDFKINGDRIELIIGGSVFVFRGEQAIELYHLLINDKKEVLNG